MASKDYLLIFIEFASNSENVNLCSGDSVKLFCSVVFVLF